jgi:hypothetical protein
MEGVRMRAHHVTAVVVMLILGLGARHYLSPTKVAEADKQAALNNDLNILQMQRDLRGLPTHNLLDYTLVFGAD